MKYNVVSYLIGEGFRNVLKNKKSTISALTIMCLSMFVFGIFFIIGENINHVMNTIQDAQGIRVFIKTNVEDGRVKELGQEIQKIDGVKSIEYISPEDALNQMKEELKDNASAIAGMSEERFPPSYLVNLTQLEANTRVQQEIRSLLGEELDDITSSNDTITTLIAIGKGIRVFTFILLLILVIISIVIIANTIKLTVHARRKEISIMKYVGATNSFIRWPFIVEGIIIGIVAAVVTMLIVGVIYNQVAQSLVQTEVVRQLNMSFVTFSDMFNLIAVIYIVLGIGIGTIGSSISMRKYLEV